MRRALILAAAAAPILCPAASAHPGGGRVVPEIVHIPTDDGQSLEGSFRKPASGKAPAIVLVHDAGGDRSQLDPLADKLSKQGFGVLTLDLRGHGGSKSEALDWSKLSESDRKATWLLAPHDVDAATKWVLGQPNIQSTSLSLVGYGAGCALVVRHAKGDENVVCITLLAPNTADVRSDIQTLVGLPTFVVASKDDEAERMVKEANAASSGGVPYVDVFLAAPKATTSLLEDKRLPTKISDWISDKALPKKARAK